MWDSLALAGPAFTRDNRKPERAVLASGALRIQRDTVDARIPQPIPFSGTKPATEAVVYSRFLTLSQPASYVQITKFSHGEHFFDLWSGLMVASRFRLLY